MKPRRLILLALCITSTLCSLQAEHWSFAMSVDQSQGVIQPSDEGPFIDLNTGKGMQLPEGLARIPDQDGSVIFRGEFKADALGTQKKAGTLVGWGDRREHSRILVNQYGKRLRAIICGPGKGRKSLVLVTDPIVEADKWYTFEFKLIRGKPLELTLNGKTYSSAKPIRNLKLIPEAPLCLGIAYQPGFDARNPFMGLLRNFEALTGPDVQ